MKKEYRLLKLSALVAGLFIFPALSSQTLNQLWTGLRTPQKDLPVSNATVPETRRVPKRHIPTSLTPLQPGEWVLSQGWEMTDGTTVIESRQSIFDPKTDTQVWYNATVPGTVLTTLVDQGVYPDPYYGLNNLYIPDSLCRTDWWYRIVFEVPENTANKKVRLVFDGINYRAEIFLNGKKAGKINGAFIRGDFDVTSLIKNKEKNVLAVRILPPDNPGIPHEQSIKEGQGLNGGTLSLDGPTFISSIGWDWIPGIRDRNMGIWQKVKLKIGGDVIIGDPLIVTDLALPDTTRAAITLKTDIRNTSGKTVKGNLYAHIEGTEISAPYTLQPFEQKEIRFSPEEHPELNMAHPRLWWPNGYGTPALYDLTLEADDGNGFSDRKKIRFGIRELSYELMINTPDKGNIRVSYTPNDTRHPGKPVFDYEKRVHYTPDNQLPTLAKNADTSGLKILDPNDPVGPFLVLRVNGVRIFCRGGNWGMDDGMKRCSRERLEPYFKLHKEAHFNIIRNWTGESTEEDFYALCDEYGMLVWNDFWITTDDTVEPNDFPLFLRNATDVIRRFRNHPSIAVWCPRNEGFAPAELAPMLSAMAAKEDPTRHYHGQSRYLNMGTSGPWGYLKNPADYFTKNAKGFLTELGTYAVPTASTIRKFIAPQDLWPINDVWAYHDLHHTTQNFDDFMQAVNRYGTPSGMEDFADKAQFVTYEAWRDMLEAWNSKMWNNTTGLILWMTHPAWPSMIWQTYSYDYETPGSYFGARKACEPLHIQMNRPDDKIVIVNTTRNDAKSLTATLRYFDPDGKELFRKSGKFHAAANAFTDCFLPEKPSGLPSLYLARVELKDRKGRTLSINDYWRTTGDSRSYQALSQMPASRLTVRLLKENDRNRVEITNISAHPAVSIKLNATNPETGEIILPAYFSEGYFNLLPGEKRIIEFSLPEGYTRNFNVIASAYNDK